MESKALEKLGILRPKRTFGNVVRSFLRKTIAFALLIVCIWGGIRYVMSRREGNCADVVVTQDDGSLFICEHLAVKKMMQHDLQTKDIGGRLLVTGRQYWFKLTIDEHWYFNKFVPQVKKYLSEIAPSAETDVIMLDTKDLTYKNDGADRLIQLRWGMSKDGDRFNWDETLHTMRGSAFSDWGYGVDERYLLLFDGQKDNGALICATRYKLRKPQLDKFENWIAQHVLRSRVGVSVVMRSGSETIASGTWPTSGIRPIGEVYCQNRQCYAVSPWLDVRAGMRCRFLGIRCVRQDGVPDKVEVKWSL